METIAAELQTVLRRALAELPDLGSEAIAAAVVTPAADRRFGDYQTNIAMTLAKQRRVNPRALAAEIVAALGRQPALADLAGPPEMAGAGFINFRLTPACLAARLAAIAGDPARLGVNAAAGRRVVIDFSSPNIAKPMHVGHLRSTIIGDCLARLAAFLGYEVITDNHLGDWGTQFGKVIYGWKHFLDEKALAADPLAELVRIYQEANTAAERGNIAHRLEQLLETDERLHERFAGTEVGELLGESKLPQMAEDFLAKVPATSLTVADACRAELAKLQAGDAENLAIWRRCVELSRAELDEIYARLGVRFDHQLGESFFHPQLAPLIARLEAAGIAQPSEGALVVFFADDPKLADKPAIIRKRDGAFNYAATDLATYEYRVNEWHADALWYVVGAPQALHFAQVNAIVARMGFSVPIIHVPHGSILGEDRKIMRTRSGANVALKELLDEAIERARKIVDEKNPTLPEDERAEVARKIGLGAIKYAELSQHRMTDYVFSWDRMLSLQGNTAPYLLNAWVRIRSIFRHGGLDPDAAPAIGLPLEIADPAERDLALQLAQFAEIVPAALEDFRPNLLANYLHELAGIFHAFFEACPVLKAPEGVRRETRLTLCGVTARTLGLGLDLLGIETPERM